MNQDVDDTKNYIAPQGDQGAPNDGRSSNWQKPHILLRIRNLNLAISSIGSAFSNPLSAMGSYIFQENQGISNSSGNNYDINSCTNDPEATRISGRYDQSGLYAPENSALIQTCSSSPSQLNRLSDVKRIILNSFTRSRQINPHDRTHSRTSSSIESNLSAEKYHHEQRASQSPHASCTHLPNTPPLTPDAFDENILPSPVFPDVHDSRLQWCSVATDRAVEYYHEDDAIGCHRSRSRSVEIKEGKKPERASDIPYDVAHTQPVVAKASPSLVSNDQDEWFGLEYTLELSGREYCPSDTQSFSMGEHSKSRESWAAIHQGTIHPFFEDEDYHQWKNWHRYLDQQDELRKYKKAMEFEERSASLAWYYADEMRTRDVMYWQKAVYGVIARDVKERLYMLAEHRPDPYIPMRKHNLGWYLKRSCSVACLRELRPLPEPHQKDDENVNIDPFAKPNVDDYSVYFEE